MTRQEMFNKAWHGVIAQGGPSMVDGHCLYRGWNGRKCGVGHLIGDEVAHRWDMLKKSGVAFMSADMISKAGLAPSDQQFLVDLQNAHDASGNHGSTDKQFIAEFIKSMADVATRYSLTIPDAVT
jgi:hypothetical protein